MTAMKLMQLYSDREGSELAVRAAARLREDLGGGKCSETIWNAELLRSAKLRLIAAREAADADFVIIATREGTRLPKEIKQWLQLWRNRKRRRKAALVSLLRRDRAGAARDVERALHSFARTAKMDFFCHSRVISQPQRQIEELDLSFLV
jgi:hypothetical protein